MRISPHLNFDGRCREAFTRYQAILGGTIETMLSYGESPLAGDCDARFHDRILHATLRVGDQELMGTDQMPDTFQPPQGIMITVTVTQVNEARRIFEGPAQGGRVTQGFHTAVLDARRRCAGGCVRYQLGSEYRSYSRLVVQTLVCKGTEVLVDAFRTPRAHALDHEYRHQILAGIRLPFSAEQSRPAKLCGIHGDFRPPGHHAQSQSPAPIVPEPR